MTKGKQPLPLFVGDFLASTAEWDMDERGAYLLLLMHQWAQGSVPTDERAVAKLLGFTGEISGKKWGKIWGKFRGKFGEISPGRMANKRLEEHRQAVDSLSEKRSKVGKMGAAARHGKGMALDWTGHIDNSSPVVEMGGTGGRLAVAAPNGAESCTEMEHSINKNDKSNTRRRKRAEPEPLPDYPPELNREAWTEWTNYRLAIRKPYKLVSLPAAMKHLASFGSDQLAVVRQSITHGWQGLFSLKTERMSNPRRNSTDEEFRSNLRAWVEKQNNGGDGSS